MKLTRALTATLTALAALAVWSAVWADDPDGKPRESRVGPEPQIVGGTPAAPGAYPWQAALVAPGASASLGQFCGGSLVADKWVVTAAHCVEDGSEVDVVLGVTALSTDVGQRIPVAHVYVHQSYDPDIIDSDVAMLWLSSAANLSAVVATISPVTPADLALTAPGTLSTATGWGLTAESGQRSDVLMQVSLPIMSNQSCLASYGGGITGNMVCAGFVEGGKDSCQGDSGGPLVVPDGTSFRLAGIVSFGNGCARPGSPGVYTRVSEFSDWIAGFTSGTFADLTLTKLQSAETAMPGASFVYDILVDNLGPADAPSGVTVTDRLPSQAIFTSAGPGCSYSLATHSVRCEMGSIAAGASASTTITVTVVSGAMFASALVNTATVAGNVQDPSSKNDTSTTTATVVWPAGRVKVLLSEDFGGASGTTTPEGWSNNIIRGDAAFDHWRFDNPSGRAFNAPIVAPAAVFDSDGYSGQGGPEDVALESPVFDASGVSTVLLEFDHYFKSGFGGEVFVEVFDGSAWQAVYSESAKSTANPEHEAIDVSAHAAGVADARVRFRWTGDFSEYWAVDNVKISGPDPAAVPVPGVTPWGLLVVAGAVLWLGRRRSH